MGEERLSFSVIIPVYNGSEFIRRSIESCLQQTILPAEILVIDDASNDNTADIIKSFNNNLLRYERNETNMGPSFSRNRGILLATSAWLLFLDADDVFHPQKIEIVRYFLQQHTGIHAIGHGFDIISNEPPVMINNWDKIALKFFRAKNVLLTNPAVTPSLTVSAKNGIFFNERKVHAEDHDFVLRTAEQFGIWYADVPLCSLQRWPLSPGGTSDDKWKMRKGEMNVYIDYCKRNNLYPAIPFLLAFSLMKYLKTLIAPRAKTGW